MKFTIPDIQRQIIQRRSVRTGWGNTSVRRGVFPLCFTAIRVLTFRYGQFPHDHSDNPWSQDDFLPPARRHQPVIRREGGDIDGNQSRTRKLGGPTLRFLLGGSAGAGQGPLGADGGLQLCRRKPASQCQGQPVPSGGRVRWTPLAGQVRGLPGDPSRRQACHG